MAAAEDFHIVFDQIHNNSITIETNAYNSFIQYLFQQNMRVGKLTASLTNETLKPYKILILGNAQDSTYSINEIYAILEFVRKGGSVVIFSDEGGDLSNRSNFNELTINFGFKILPNIIYDPSNYVDKIVRPIINNFLPHPVTTDINAIVYSSGCSFEIMDDAEFADYRDVSIKPIAFTSPSAKMKKFENQKWIEKPATNSIVAVAGRYFEGRVIALGTPSLLSSLSNNYGFKARDNLKFMQNIIEWCLSPVEESFTITQILGDRVEVLIQIEKELFQWTMELVAQNQWGDLSNIINQSLKSFQKSIRKSKF
ncbi:MAG: hypothetical protein JW776_02070 [Candidatus Lokiarchaeota archaeon]|nr:hypothetical protein [Candidatus Lokiarchaeota archaeon]